MPGFGSVITAMVTPFDDEGEVDHDGVAELAQWLVAQGNDALVVTGTTGEEYEMFALAEGEIASA